jgi:hypothetical protein
MVTYQSNSSGVWSTTTIWTPNGLPTYGDIITIMPGHTISLGGGRGYRLLVVAGTLVLDNVLYAEDYSGAGISIESTGAIDVSGASAGSPRIMQSQNTLPTNPWYFQIKHVASGDDSRGFDMQYLECRWNRWFLGNADVQLWFNVGASPDELEWLDVAPLAYDPNLEENLCEGRAGSRVYYKGAGAGALQLSGRMRWDRFRWMELANLAKSGAPVALVSSFVHVKRGYLEAPRFRPTSGSRYVDFSAVLVEDA